MKILKKCNYPLLFDVLYKIVGSQDIEEIYSGMKSNVIHYGLNPFHTEYGYLDSEYYPIHVLTWIYSKTNQKLISITLN